MSRHRSAALATAYALGFVVMGAGSEDVLQAQAQAQAKAQVQVQARLNQWVAARGRLLGDEPQDRGDAPPLALAESEDLNRVLRKVTEFFAQTPPKWDEGARLLQDLLEGKVFDETVADEQMLDPFRSVYSADKRLYVPFARYCQALLCTLPPEGLESYRFLTDSRARAAFEHAAEGLDVTELQRIAELFFATESGADIVELLADAAELEGRLSQAIHLRHRLLSEYPDLSEPRREVLLLRQIHATGLLGDRAAHDDYLKQLEDRGVDRKVTVAGAEIAVRDLRDHPSFAVRNITTMPDKVEDVAANVGSVSLRSLWRFAFTEPDPYGLRPKDKKNQNGNVVWFGSMQSLALPSPRYDRPGTRVLVWEQGGQRGADLRVAIKDHDCLNVLGVVSGKVRHRGDGKATPSVVQNQMLRVRTPLTDMALQSVSTDGKSLYVTDGNRSSQAQNVARSDDFAFDNELVATDVDSGAVRWTTKNDDEGKRLFFQGPPVRHRSYLYAPVRKGDAFGIARIDAETGSVDKVVTLHSGGTRLLRVPAVLPVVADGQLICLTNAGAVAALRLPNLELRWLRAYESTSPEAPPPDKDRRSSSRSRNYQIQEIRLDKWRPLEPIIVDGIAVVAPIDSDALFALDLQTGEPVWFLPRVEAARGTDFRELVGYQNGRLYLAGGTTLQIVEARSGRRIAETPLLGLPRGEIDGWGAVTTDHVWLPFDGGAYRFSAIDGSFVGSVEYPAEELGGENWTELPQRLQFAGPVLLSICESGVTAYASSQDLAKLDGDLLLQARALAAGGQTDQAFVTLLARLAEVSRGPQRDRAASFAVRLAGELASKADRTASLATLDRCAQALENAGVSPDPRLLLFRIRALDPQADAREIRTLREKIADLPLEISASESPASMDGK
ncbi:MAG: PQQ-binding-like beta-propeller repeat protein [Planctomycetes bacterium]|nr:PQQ-binding-like beta-propeller repeat protein [Planctomycetota bacterium]MCB9916831.1 PQQ-binding-like beta-propeller repeat protein [Planctomycetota bacterium]